MRLLEAQEEGDDWTGVTNPVERRRRQNRVHQRAWRQRRAALLARPNTGEQLDGAPGSEGSSTGHYYGVLIPGPQSAGSINRLDEHTDLPSPSSGGGSPAKLIPPLIPYLKASERVHPSSAARPFRVVFPLSLDHRLITLIQFNVLRATLINISIMRLAHIVPAECSGALALLHDALLPPSAPSTIPPSLYPTELQRTTPHQAWIDSVPVAAMRDNLIRCWGGFDEDDFCDDLLGGLYEGFDDVERRGMIVWAEPWCPVGWEVTEGFVRKWGFLLRGCGDLLEATNRWRAMRGDDRLVVEV